MTQDIEIPFKDKPFPAYLSASDETDPLTEKLPGVIVIHEVWGLNEHTRDVANRIAALGYTVIAPDLLSHTGITEKMTPAILREVADPATKDEAQKKMREAMAPIHEPEFGAETLERLQACYDYLKNEQGAPKIACVGFCFGGTYTFAFAAAQPVLNAAVVFYGHAPKEEDIATITAPLIAFYGEQDTSLVSGIAELQMAFQKNHREFEHYVYPDAGHAFFNDTNALRYNKKAAEDSWAKTVDFLKRNLA
jgi:carboxymethylenebutenolidase